MLRKVKKLFQQKSFSKGRPAREGVALMFRYKYSSFKMLLDSNLEFLKVISEMEELLRGRQVFGLSQVKNQADRAVFHVLRMIKNLDDLSRHRYGALFPVLEDIKERIQREWNRQRPLPVQEPILPFDRIHQEMFEGVGGKSAHLGEIQSRLGLPVPEGFALTTRFFELFLRHQGLFDAVYARKMEIDPLDPASIHQGSQEIQRLIQAADLPPELQRALEEAYEAMVERRAAGEGRKTRPAMALRSSAVGEDSELSFAGQYLSLLNVSPDRMAEAYRQVVASLYSPRALTYRLHKGILDEDIAMAVACLEMVDALASGVIYTRHPLNPLEDHILVTAVWGLGPYAVEGRITPDTYTVAKDGSWKVLVTAISHKPVQLIPDEQGGLREVPVPEELRDTPCLTFEQLQSLSEYACRLEKHFRGPQDIEWALDRQGRLFILQARPLKVEPPENGVRPTPRLEQYPLLLEEGIAAFPGVGWGPAIHIRSDQDLIRFPEGGVLVARHSSPQFVVAMKKARAIVTDLGSLTGHMASLAREFQVPTLVDTRRATALIPEKEVITVDAYSGRIYQGKVEELLVLQKEVQSPMKGTPVYETLRRVADLIIPLNLTDPKSPLFSAEHCRTLHDLCRLIHERSYTEMFQLSDLVSGQEGFAYKLEAPVPLDLYVIDLGGGLVIGKTQKTLKKIGLSDIASVPFKALLRGMTHEAFSRPQLRPVSFSGFLSVMREQMLSPPQAGNERFGERSYAILSDQYLNFSSRVGYHYSILDAYCGPAANMNYITFSFKGGAADEIRRNRRVRAIARVLERLDFAVEATGDRVDARLQKFDAPLIEDRLDQLGRLLLYTRQMDMLMDQEEAIEAAARNFLAGNYNLSSS